MYQFYKGPIPNKAFVCHSCDNPKCCNPDHLWAGTPRDNMKDCTNKGRAKGMNSDKTHCIRGHEFTPENTRIIANGWRNCRTCLRELNKKYKREAREAREV